MSKFKVAVSVRDPADLCSEAIEFGVDANRIPGLNRMVEVTGPYDELMEFLTEAVGMSGDEADTFVEVYGREV